MLDSIPSKLTALIQRGDVLADVFIESVNFNLPIGKREAVLHAVDVLGTKPENIAFIEDREIGPLTITGFACCPNNAKPEIKNYVEQR